MSLDNDKIAKIMAEAQRMRRNRVSNEKINAFVDRSLDKLRQEMSAKADADLTPYRDWETDRKSTRLNSSHRSLARMPSSA